MPKTITTIGTYQAPSANKVRFKEVDATNFPGLYEIHAADAAYDATGSRRSVGWIAFGAAGMAPVPWERQLTGSDINDGVRAGLSALPTPAPGRTGGLPIVMQGNLAVAATGSTITLDSTLTVDRLPNGTVISIVAGTGIGQVRTIVDYVGSTNVATVNRPWRTNPDTTSVYNLAGPETLPWPVFQSGVAQSGGA